MLAQREGEPLKEGDTLEEGHLDGEVLLLEVLLTAALAEEDLDTE